MTWTKFWDMNSGGGQKEKWSEIYIEADKTEATSVFYSRFGHNPNRVSCTCCGSDYSISTDDTITEVTGYSRNLRFAVPSFGGKNWKDLTNEERISRDQQSRYLEIGEPVPDGFSLETSYTSGDQVPLDEFAAQDDILMIYADEISEDERKVDVPQSGYVWID